MASFSYEQQPASLGGYADQIVVARYNRTTNKFSVIPNVQCDAITEKEGLEPQTARFHYVLDGMAVSQGWPTQPEEIFALVAAKGSGSSKSSDKEAKQKRYVIYPDDEICVLRYAVDAKDETDYQILFHGFSESPEVSVSGSGQTLSFDAAGVAIRLWDSPLTGRVERDADSLTSTGADHRHEIDLPPIFNVDGKPNCTPDGSDESADNAVGGGNRFPIFLDPNIKRSPDRRTFWTLPKFTRYLLGYYNDEEFVDNPDFSMVDRLLVSRQAKSGGIFDPDDSTTYDVKDITLVEYDATGKPWPQALQEQLGYNGFGCKLVLDTEADGTPTNRIEIYRKDGTGIGDPIDCYLQVAGSDLDPAKTNTQEISITRDYKATRNSVQVDSGTEEVEISVVLTPGFLPGTGDESAANITQFYKANQSSASEDVRNKYRLYIADEAGDGHYYRGNDSFIFEETALDLSSVFPEDDAGFQTYCKRTRPGRSTLVSLDASGRPRKAQLHFSRDYTGRTPKLWDGTGTWQEITQGWELLKDRLGIYVNVEDPESWSIGKYTNADPQEPSYVLKGVSSHSAPSGEDTVFYLRLTTVIRGDKRPVGVIDPRPSSALKYPRTLYAHAKEQFKFQRVSKQSLFNDSELIDVTVRDDSDGVRDFAAQLQQAHENPLIAGRFVIPWIDLGYPIGEAIRSIKGRDLSLQVNARTSAGEAKRYPTIVGRTWDFTGGQKTLIQISDHRADPR